VIKLNGKKYFCCNEILCEIIAEISKIFDAYTYASSPFPPCNGILSMNVKSKQQVDSIKLDIESKISAFYEQTEENCVRPDVMLEFLNNLEHSECDMHDYPTYAMTDNETKYFNFLHNVCIEICKNTISLL
jgi:hypothetical protein